MAEMENFSDINQNFDTIKTLLNSIRAQGILNTSDVDKLLTGINAKLEKINTEEDIDLIKIFLSELKQNLEERHSVLVSKFGAIESLFTNLLKNTSEMPKSTDIKELFDIVATNLSVFSREVVSQKDSITEIALKLDAIRSDDTNKKDIIKNITLLKPDLERLNNGFDSIVISLNDNFKTIIKTITTIDKTEYLDKFADELRNIDMSSNTILSALQMLDKKTEQVENVLQNLATKEDVTTTGQRLFDLTAQSHELKAMISDISNKYTRIDSLAEKIDASVNIIANLKAIIDEGDNNHTRVVTEQLKILEAELKNISTDDRFDNFKNSLESVLKNIAEGTSIIDSKLVTTSKEIHDIENIIKALDINVNFSRIADAISKTEEDVKASINEVSMKIATLQDANISRVLQDISSGADLLGSKINQTQTEMAILCEKNFGTVFDNISEVKRLLSQIDENSISANNAVFSSLSDRLTIFENSLHFSLENQEKTLSDTSSKLAEQVENIKNLSSVIDYKLDSTVVETNNIKTDLSSIQSGIDSLVALDFTNAIKELRVDLYASKQEMVNIFESTGIDLSEKILTDFYGKYELLINKLDLVEEELGKNQAESLFELKNILDKISNSIIDVLSYVSESKTSEIELLGDKITEIAEVVKENSLSHIEDIRDIVDVIKVQVENSLTKFEENNFAQADEIKITVAKNAEDIRKELKYSYNKIIEIQDSYQEFKELINLNNTISNDNIEKVLSTAETIKSDYNEKLNNIKNTLVESIDDFKAYYLKDSSSKENELSLLIESSQSKATDTILSLIEELKAEIDIISKNEVESKAQAVSQILEKFIAIENLYKSANENLINNADRQTEKILNEFSSIKEFLNNFDVNIDEDLTRQLSILESNFESLVSQISILFDKSDNVLTDKFSKELALNSEGMQNFVLEKFEDYRYKIECSIDNLSSETLRQSNELQEKISNLYSSLNLLFEQQSEANNSQIEDIKLNIKSILDENIKLTAVDYIALKNKLTEFSKSIEIDNQALISKIESQFESIKEATNIKLEAQIEEIATRSEDLKADVSANLGNINTKAEEINSAINENTSLAIETKENLSELRLAIADNQNSIDSLENFAKLKYGQLTTNNESINASLNNITTLSNKTIEDVSLLKSDIETAINSIDSNSKLISDVEGNLLNKLELLKSISSEIIDNKSLINNLDSSISNKLRELENISNGILANGDLINNLDSSISNKLRELENISNSILANGDLINNIDSSILNRLGELENISNGILANGDLLNNLDSSISNNLRELEIISNSILANRDSINNLDSSISNKLEELSLLSNDILANNASINNLDTSLTMKLDELKEISSKIADSELKTLDEKVQEISDKLEVEKEQFAKCKDLIVDFSKKELNIITDNIEKETDTIIRELIEQFDLLRKSHDDEIIKLTTQIEDIVNTHIYNNIEDLKSYLDIKTDNSVINGKLDNLKLEVSESINEMIEGLNRLLDTSLFTSSLSDFKAANELFINSTADRINSKIEQITADCDKLFEDKIILFDKKIVGLITDKYEEIKLISNQNNDNFVIIQKQFNDVLSSFDGVKSSLQNHLDSIAQLITDSAESTNKEVQKLTDCFEHLRSQISNKSFDEAFQASINKQISSLESLINTQMGHIEDINELCSNNLPDVTELNTLVKHSVLESINKFSNKLDTDITELISGKLEKEELESSLNQVKTDIITQFLNVFNQISFVAEQEEIIDFIQEKHDELITILSHIVTTSADISTIKDNVSLVDGKIDELRDDISIINEKISSILSADGEVDYIYSLQEIESDIAGLRLVLNDIKNTHQKQNLSELIASTNEIYSLVESLKTELPAKKDLNSISEEIESISTRTNKLILVSDESYKTLQDNLQEFKLVVNDLDERTRNFADESGMTRIDSKLNALNNMLHNGAKTNQIFNQIFEYLAEWVDKAGMQIDTITNKVETLDDIEQIKAMLSELKSGSEDNTETIELIETLGSIFDKQAKKINSLEAKLDKIIVETTINNRNNSIDVAQFDTTLNKFLVAMDEKISSQQDKINSLESKLENVIEHLDEKNAANLTKKVGGMDRQIAKLNKSIEKIASYVVEK